MITLLFHPVLSSRSTRSWGISACTSTGVISFEYPYIFFPLSASVAFHSSLSRASSIKPMCPRRVPSNSSLLPIRMFKRN